MADLFLKVNTPKPTLERAIQIQNKRLKPLAGTLLPIT